MPTYDPEPRWHAALIPVRMQDCPDSEPYLDVPTPLALIVAASLALILLGIGSRLPRR